MKTLLATALLILILPACKTTSSQDAQSASPPPTSPITSSGASASAGSEKQSAAPSTITSATDANPEESKVLAQGRELTSLFYKGETASIWASMTDEMKEGLRNEAALTTVREQMADQLGAETKVVDEENTLLQGIPSLHAHCFIFEVGQTDEYYLDTRQPEPHRWIFHQAARTAEINRRPREVWP